jgi:hypothetical protein
MARNTSQHASVANVVPSSPILVTLMIEETRTLEKLVHTKPHGVIYQKTAFFIVTAVKILNLT